MKRPRGSVRRTATTLVRRSLERLGVASGLGAAEQARAPAQSPALLFAWDYLQPTEDLWLSAQAVSSLARLPGWEAGAPGPRAGSGIPDSKSRAGRACSP